MTGAGARALTRRRLLIPLVAATATYAVAAVLPRVQTAAARLRPAAWGTSATRCAHCGAQDHNMLDRRCPFAPRVL